MLKTIKWRIIALLSLIIALLYFTQSWADVYQWTDNNGVVHFSDEPREGAKKLQLPDVQHYSPPINKSISTKQPSAVKFSYDSITILEPKPETTYRNEDVNVVVDIKPTLQPGDKLQVLLNQQVVGKPQQQTTFKLTNVERGAHNVSVQIISDQGNVLKESSAVTFFMHRARVNMIDR
ncbi:MAG: DUF4124 domain-containing protein [Gammaproteobacteria bacterium]